MPSHPGYFSFRRTAEGVRFRALLWKGHACVSGRVDPPSHLGDSSSASTLLCLLPDPLKHVVVHLSAIGAEPSDGFARPVSAVVQHDRELAFGIESDCLDRD
jgi:hypothetical protein